MLEKELYNKKKQYRNRIECPTCHQFGCFEHCNHCGIKIKWKNEQGDPVYTDGKRTVFEEDFSVHRCMQKGTKDGKFYSTGKTFDEAEWNAEMRKYNYRQQHFMCMECGREYNKEIYPKCLTCWKMECRKCGNRVAWRANKETYCVVCGNDKRDPVHVWNSYNRNYGKPKNLYS